MRFIRAFFLMSLVLLGACSQPALPTAVPTLPPATATATVTPTRTPLPTPEPTSTPMRTISDDPSQQSQIRVVHASPNIGALDVYIERTPLINNLSYGQRTTASPVVAGTYTLSIVPVGGRLDDGTLIKLPLDIKGRELSVLVVYGTNADLKAQVIPMDLSSLKKTENRVRLFNTFVDGGPVTLVNTPNETIMFGDIAANTLSPAQSFSAENMDLQVRAGTIPLTDVSSAFAPMTSSLVILAGSSTDRASMQAITIDAPVSGQGRVRILNAVEDLRFNLDVYANDVLIAPAVVMNGISEAVTLTSGTYNLTLYNAGDDPATAEALLTGTEFQVGPDQDVIVALFGRPEAIAFESVVENVGPVGIDGARILFFNPVTTAPNASVTSGVLPEIVPVNYGRFSAPYDVPARTTTFMWTQSDSEGNLINLETAVDLILEPGESYLYIFDARGIVQFDFLYKRTVGQSENVLNALVTPTAIPSTLEPAPRLRMVNALPNQFVEFRLDDVAVARGLPYGNASSPVLTEPGDRTLTVLSSDGAQLLARSPITLKPSLSYTAYVYGETVPYKILVVEDRPLYHPTVPAFRVINLSTDPREVGAAITPYIPQPPNPDLPAGQQSPAYSIPGGIERLAYDVPTETATEFVFLRGNLEPSHTIFLLDADQDVVVSTLPNTPITGGMSYDIVLFKSGGAQVRGFITAYPPF